MTLVQCLGLDARCEWGEQLQPDFVPRPFKSYGGAARSLSFSVSLFAPRPRFRPLYSVLGWEVVPLGFASASLNCGAPIEVTRTFLDIRIPSTSKGLDSYRLKTSLTPPGFSRPPAFVSRPRVARVCILRQLRSVFLPPSHPALVQCLGRAART